MFLDTEPIMIVTTVNEKLMWAQDQRIKQFEEHLKYLENQETIRQQTQSKKLKTKSCFKNSLIKRLFDIINRSRSISS